MEISSGTTVTTVSSSNATAHRATIAEGSFLINLLVTSLYTNPALAAVREIVANAVDANNMVGRNHVPVLLVLPTNQEPVCIIQDNGPGMPTNLFFDHYICVGDSSKRSDVNQIGGMGIGCKAPLAYSPMFRVVVAFQGKRTQFTIALQSDGYPWAQEDYCVDNNDPSWTSGMRIEIPVRQEDIRQFQAIGSQVTRWHAVQPTIQNLENPLVLDPIPYGYTLPSCNFEGDPSVRGLERNKCNPWSSSPLLIEMGGLVYPLAAKDLASLSQISPMAVKLLSNMNGVHHAPMGAVSPAPSREALKFDTKTLTYIADFAENVIEALAQPILTVIENEHNVSSFEFSRQLYAASALPRRLFDVSDFNHRGGSAEWVSFFKTVCDFADIQFGKQNRDHRSLALSARTAVLAVPRSIGAFCSPSIRLTAVTPINNRGSYKPYKSEINSNGQLLSSRGSASPYSLDINKPFHLVFVDCTYIATRLKHLLSSSSAPNILLVHAAKQPGKDKLQPTADSLHVAQQIANLPEFRGLSPVSLSSLTVDPSLSRVSSPRGKALAGLSWEETYGEQQVDTLSLVGAELTETPATLASITADADPDHTLYILHNNRGYRNSVGYPYENDGESLKFSGSLAHDTLKSFLYLYEFVHGVVPTLISVPTQAKANRFKFSDQGIRPAIPAFLELGMLACNETELPQLLLVQPPPHLSSYSSSYRITSLVDVIRNLRERTPSYVPPTPEINLLWNAVPLLDKEIAKNEYLREQYALSDPSTITDLDLQQKVYEYQKIQALLLAIRSIPASRMPEKFTLSPPETLTPAQKIHQALEAVGNDDAIQFVTWRDVISQENTGLISTFLSVCIQHEQLPLLQQALAELVPSSTTLDEPLTETSAPTSVCEID